MLDYVIAHSKSVAEVMYQVAKQNKEEMYILGLLHDIGKITCIQSHSILGYELCEKVGFKYSREILYHGKVQNEYQSYELDLLNMADLTVDYNGDIVGYTKRIESIGNRYGQNSNEYYVAKELVESLLSKGICYIK